MRGYHRRETGFTYIELLIAASLLMVSLLGLSGMFIAGYSHVNSAGKSTMGLSAARQFMEDVRRLPFDDLPNLNGFDTDDPSSLPSAGPERDVARRWRYALAGDGVGWSFTDNEKARWPTLSAQGDALDASGTVSIAQQTGTLTAVTVTVAVPGRWRHIEISTLIADLP